MDALWGLLLLLFATLAGFVILRAAFSLRGARLEPWHRIQPGEPDAGRIEQMDWSEYCEEERRLFERVAGQLREETAPAHRIPGNRFFEGSPLNSRRFEVDWNRSQTFEPEGCPDGGVVLLHGLTDSPYSMRHLAAHYRQRGFLAAVPRLPGHGMVPGGLAEVCCEEWAATVRMAVREIRRKIPDGAPLHLVGFSNGAALALRFALDCLENAEAFGKPPDRLVFLSPMIGITSKARFAGIAGWPAVFPVFAKAAWLQVLPEFNPFKFNSLPVHAARQSSLLTRSLHERIAKLAARGLLENLPPVLTFQSVMDHTTSARAVVTELFEKLPGNGSELVLFDLNRSVAFGPLLRESAEGMLARILPPAPRRFGVWVVGNRSTETCDVAVFRTRAGETETSSKSLDLRFPPGVFSLSHVALPFPESDSLYGINPALPGEFGVSLGALAPRGERGTLLLSLDTLARMTCNPFFDVLLERIARFAEHPPT